MMVDDARDTHYWSQSGVIEAMMRDQRKEVKRGLPTAISVSFPLVL